MHLLEVLALAVPILVGVSSANGLASASAASLRARSSVPIRPSTHTSGERTYCAYGRCFRAAFPRTPEKFHPASASGSGTTQPPGTEWAVGALINFRAAGLEPYPRGVAYGVLAGELPVGNGSQDAERWLRLVKQLGPNSMRYITVDGYRAIRFDGSWDALSKSRTATTAPFVSYELIAVGSRELFQVYAATASPGLAKSFVDSFTVTG